MKLIQVKLMFGNDLLVVRLVFFHHSLKEKVSFLVISIHHICCDDQNLRPKYLHQLNQLNLSQRKLITSYICGQKKQLFELRGESHIDFRIDIDRRLPMGV